MKLQLKKIEEKTYKYYQECSDYYEYLYSDHLKYSEIFFDKILGLLKQHNVRTILDASCGSGHDMLTLLKYNFIVDGADISVNMLKNAKKKLTIFGYKNCRYFNVDVRNLKELNKNLYYDAVIFRGNTFSNLPPEDIEIALNSLYDCIKKNGIIIIDYRDGLKQFSKKNEFEYRCSGYSTQKKSIYFSYYSFQHATQMQCPYTVKAYIWYWKNILSFPKKYSFTINSFYVNGNIIKRFIKSKKLNQINVRVNHKGLPFLKSLILIKK